jgi:hypothetical protein
MIRLLCLAAVLLASTGARADITDCIDVGTLPFGGDAYHLRAPGVYCLKQPFPAARAIRIDADDVLLDLNGHSTTFIQTQRPQRNITVRNGVTSGGVSLMGPAALVEHMRAREITADGDSAVIRHNVVLGGSMWGIFARGRFVQISDNRVLESGIGKAGESNGIKLQDARGAIIARNVIANSVRSGGAWPIAIQIMPLGDARAIVAGNRITNMPRGVTAHPLIGFGTISALVRDNVLSNTPQPFSGQGIVLGGTTNVSF